MSNSRYAGRHRASAQPSHGRRVLVPLALVSTTVAGAVVVRSAGASELSPEAAAIQDLSDSVNGVGIDARNRAIAAAGSNREGTRASRDLSRAAVASVVNLTDQKASDVGSVAAAARLLAEAKTADEARKAAEAKQADTATERAHRWVAPLSSYTLTSGFGWRWGRLHPAQDLGTPVGSPVHALSSGTVVFSGWSSEGYGYLVQIRYWDGTVSWFAHNSRLVVSVGERVTPGQVVSYSGNTGHSTGPHLHLEIHPQGGAAVPPIGWLARKGIRL